MRSLQWTFSSVVSENHNNHRKSPERLELTQNMTNLFVSGDQLIWKYPKIKHKLSIKATTILTHHGKFIVTYLTHYTSHTKYLLLICLLSQWRLTIAMHECYTWIRIIHESQYSYDQMTIKRMKKYLSLRLGVQIFSLFDLKEFVAF